MQAVRGLSMKLATRQANAPNPGEGNASDDMWVFLTNLSEGAVLHANMPYVYKPLKTVENYAFTTENTTLKAKNTGVIAKSETLEDVYSFYATYDNTTPTDDDPFYYVSINGGISLGNDGSVTVGPYRWIIRKTSKFGDTPSYARQMFFYEDEVTDIGDAERLNDKGQTINDSWYTLDGRRLDSVGAGPVPARLRKGIYIVGGRKVVIK